MNLLSTFERSINRIVERFMHNGLVEDQRVEKYSAGDCLN